MGGGVVFSQVGLKILSCPIWLKGKTLLGQQGNEVKATDTCRKAEVGWTGLSDGETTALQKFSVYYIQLKRK